MSLIHRWDWNLSREEWSLRKLTPGKKQSISYFRVYFAHDYVFFGRELSVKSYIFFSTCKNGQWVPFSGAVSRFTVFYFSLQESYFKPFSYFPPPPPFNLSKLLGNPHLFLFLKTSMFSQHEPLKYQGHHSAKNNNCVRKNELFML